MITLKNMWRMESGETFEFIPFIYGGCAFLFAVIAY